MPTGAKCVSCTGKDLFRTRKEIIPTGCRTTFIPKTRHWSCARCATRFARSRSSNWNTGFGELMAQASRLGFWFCDLPFDKLVWDKHVKEHFGLAHDAVVTIDTFYERLHP